MSSLCLPGSFLLRQAERTFLPLLFHEPPRNTRASPAMASLATAPAEQPDQKWIVDWAAHCAL
jgi:hypothetical protein